MKKNNIIIGILMLIALGGALFLVNKNQEMRKGAAFANTILKLLPSEKIVANVNESFSVHLHYITEGGAKLYNIDTVICYDPRLELLVSESRGNVDLGYGDLIINNANDEIEGDLTRTSVGVKCSRVIALKNISSLNLAETSGEVAVLKFKSSMIGSGNINIDKERSKATGENPNSETDKWITVTEVENTSYEITGSSSETCETDADCPAGYECYQPPMPICPPGESCLDVMPPKYCRPISSGEWPVLNYKVQYAFVKPDYSKCFVANDWPLQITVLSGGTTKTYNDVVPSKINRSGDFVTAEGSLILEGFDKTTNVAVFIKGPKHLQMKYAVDKQGGRYNKAGGELTLTKFVETSPVYDFTAYPILPGDIKGENSDNPDGVVNGYDWTEVKKWVKVLETVEDGGYIKADLDGSCQVNSNDLYILRLTLEEKQGELY